MDTLLIVITGASLAMAAGMGAVLARLVREERRRSDARVADLMARAGGPGRGRVSEPLVREAPGVARRPVRPAAPRGPSAEADLDLRPAPAPAPVAGVADLFSEPERSSPWGARFAAAALMVAVVGTLGYALLSPGRSGPQGPAAAAVEPAAPPLELISLTHSAGPQSLTVSGIVRNPRNAPERSRLIATGFAFGADGTSLGSGRAPTDMTRLGGGDESPFVVTIPVTGPVARYRVGFRAEDGGVIAHVDARSASEAIARK